MTRTFRMPPTLRPVPPALHIARTLSALSALSAAHSKSQEQGPLPRPHEDLSPTFLGYVFGRLDQSSPDGNLARAIRRDPCFPTSPDTSYIECRKHIEEVHWTQPELLEVLQAIFHEWIAAWSALYERDPELHHYLLGITKHPPRQDIFEAAAESGLNVNHNGMAFCWNDVPDSETQGHFGGNRERSMKLYQDNQTFQCHQCGIWGWSDQLKARTWQGRK